MAEFMADNLASLRIDLALGRGQVARRRPARSRRLPAGQRLISCLGVLMAQAMHIAQSSRLALAVIHMLLLDIGLVRRDQRTGSGQCPGNIEHCALLRCRDGDAARFAAFRP